MQTGETRLIQGGPRSKNEYKIIIGIFTHNNEGVIERIISPLSSISSEIVICDDASTDSTAKIAQTLNAQVITQPHRLGIGAGMRSLFLAANQADADVLVTVPTDAQCDSINILKLAKSVIKREADIVIGSRTSLRQTELSSVQESSLLTVYGLPVHDARSPFRAYSKIAISAMVSRAQERSDILPEARKLGLGVMEYEISTRPLQKAVPRISREIGGSGRVLELVAVRHPVEFFGGAAIIALALAIVKTFLTFESFYRGGSLPDFDVIVSITLFLVWIMLSIATAVLYVLSRNLK